MTLIQFPAFQEKSGQTEKGEEIAAEVDSEKTTFEIGARVACLSTWDEMYRMCL